MTHRVRPSQFPGEIWTVSVKLRGLGEMFSMASGDPPLGDEALKGLSYLLRDLVDELSKICDALDCQR